MDPQGSYIRRIVLLLLLALVAAGCGTRLEREEILAQNSVEGGRAIASGRIGDGGSVDDDSQLDVGSTPDEQTGTDGSGATSSGGGQSGTATGAAQGTQASKAPVTIGFVGWLGGVGGAGVTPIRAAVLAWSKMVNAGGGVNGHPVKVLVGNSNGSDAAALSIVRDFVENKGAVAILYADTALGGVATYAQEKQVPIISTITVDPLWNTNPFLFPTIANLEPNAWARARLAKLAGVKKVGSMYCDIDAACEQGKNLFAKYAKDEGLEVVYEGKVSIANPDYAAECNLAKAAGAELIFPLADVNSVIRMAQSCGRQDYFPIWTTGGKDAMLKYKEFDRAIGAPPGFAWFIHSGSPGADEYGTALEKYAPELLTEGIDAQAWGWLAAKIFQTAAAKSAAEKLTSQDILNGLWSFKGETLGGLLPGGSARTYTKGQPTPDTYCVADAQIKGGKWVAPRGLEPVCR